VAVGKAKWWRRHPLPAALASVAVLAVLAAGTVLAVRVLTRPKLECGAGTVANSSSSVCVGVNLTGSRISPDQPARLTALLADIRSSNDAVTGTDYVSIVLLQDFTPIQDVDTTGYDDVYQDVEGAITAVWQANHTAAFSGSPEPGVEPKVKLFLANMGSKNADWEKAVDQIAANATANHITAVAGLGQSTDNTRWAATKLTTTYRIPVIGATVTGDSMNLSKQDGKTLLNGFFRVSATNSDTVTAAARYVAQGLHTPADRVAIVEDTVTADDYVASLVDAAHRFLGTAHRFPFTSPDINTDTKTRTESLRGQFGYLDINLCAAKPDVVYFAGRGADIATFVTTWTESGTECSNRPLIVLTGDDGLEAVRSDEVAKVVRVNVVKVQYTALASPGKWGDCPPTPQNAVERSSYDQFQAAFTGEQACDTEPPSTPDNAQRLAFPVEDLDNGEAILSHDAVALAVTTARRTGDSARTDPMSQIGVLQQTRCRTVFHGASGTIQFSADREDYGNPVGTVLPILNITADKRAVAVPPGWPGGGPSPTAGC
jgi:hypothetical protein